VADPETFDEYRIRLLNAVANPPPAPTPARPGGEIQIDLGDLETFTTEVRDASKKGPVTDPKRALTPVIRDQRKATPPLAPKPGPPEPTQVADLPPLEEPLPPLPPVEDTPVKQGAPDLTPMAVVDIRPSPGPVSPGRTPEYYWSLVGPPLPRSIDELIGRQVPPPASTVDFDALIRQTLRNEIPGERHPSHAEPTAREPPKEADPVDLHSGAFTLAVVDLEVPSPHLPIVMARRYRSGRPYHGPLGFGWDHAYNVYLRPLNDGGMALWTGELREENFVARDGGFAPEPGNACDLTRLPGPAEVYQIRHPGGLVWTFERPAGWTDGERIPLLRIADRHGNALALIYGPLNRVVSVLDEAGRGLVFHYGQCELLEKVTDHKGERAVAYEHDIYVEHLVRVVLPATAQYPKGLSTTYEYDEANPHPAMQHNILRIFDADGRLMVENDYGAPQEEWRFNCVLAQRLGGFEYAFDYQQIQYVWPDPAYVDVLASRTVVRTPDGALHTYSFNYRGDVLDYRFRLCRDRSFRVVASQFRHDIEGNLIEAVDPDGARTLFTYDHASLDPCARRNLLKVERLAPGPGAPSRIVMQAWYDPAFQLVRRVRDEDLNETLAHYDFDGPAGPVSGRLVSAEAAPVVLVDGAAQQSKTSFECNARGQVTAITSPGGARTTVEYHAADLKAGFVSRVTRDVDGAALVTETDYDGRGFVARITGPGGRVSRIQRNALGQVEVFFPPDAGAPASPIRQWFGDAGAPVRIERPRGGYAEAGLADPFIAEVYEHDIQGALIGVRLAANTARPRATRIRCDHAGRPVQTWDAAGTRIDRAYDERGLLLSETVGAGGPHALTTRFVYDRVGGLQHRHDPDGGVTTIHHDPWGRPEWIDLPNGARRRLTWASRDLMTEVVVEEPDGAGGFRALFRESFSHDARGRLVGHTVHAFTDPAGPAKPLTTQRLLDPDDRVIRLILPRGAAAEYDYDGLGRPTRSQDAAGAVRAFSYDPAGELSSLTLEEMAGGPLAPRTQTHVYDGRGRLTAIDGPAGRMEFDYDERGYLVERREPGGVVTRFALGPHGELDEQRLDPAGLSITSMWTYDAAGRVATFRDPTGEVTRWDRDDLGRSVTAILGDGSAFTSSFDAAGRLFETVSPSGARITHAYRIGVGGPTGFSCSAPVGADPVGDHAFAYDGLGRLTEATSPFGTVRRGYDSLGRIVSEEAQGLTVRRSFDDTAGTSTLELPDGRRETVAYDAAGRPISVGLATPGLLGGAPGEILLALSYQGASKPLTESFGNGVTSEHGYDDAGRLIRVDVTRGGALIDSSRTAHDVRSRRALHQTLGAAQTAWRMVFDRRDRLVDARAGFALPPLADQGVVAQEALLAVLEPAAAAAPLGEAYDLDAADQRRSRTPAGGPPEIDGHAPGHRIAADAAGPVAYYPDGQRASASGLAHDIDALGRTVRVRDVGSGAVLAAFQHDALSRVAAGSREGEIYARWFADGDWVHEAFGMAGGVRQRSLHPLTGQSFRLIHPSESLYLHGDGALSSACVTDALGAVREHHRFSPFGEPTVFAADGVTPIAPAAAAVTPIWRGMGYLAGAGLYRSERRLYDPALGEFTSRDPLLYADSPAPYAFAGHNPVDYADVTGLAKTPLGSPPAEPDRTTETEWAYPTPDHRLIQPITRVDTGNRPVNIVLNKVILPWRNLLAFYENVLLAAALSIDDALEHSPVQQEYHALQAMGPMAEVMAIGVAFEEALVGLRYLEALTSQISTRNLALNLMPTNAGGFLGGDLPIFKSSSRRGMGYQILGDTPVLAAEADWARYQVSATGSRTETVINLVSDRAGLVRTILLDSRLKRGSPILEAKYGDLGQMFNAERYDHIIRQSYDLIDIGQSLKLPGVQYLVSSERGAVRLISTFTMEHPQHLRSGFLVVRWHPF